MLAPSGSDSMRSSRKCNSVSDDDSGCALDEYSLVPSGLSPLQVHQYMSSLPEMKMPCGSNANEKHRIRQLLRQLPPQDSKANYCIGLSDEEKNEFHLFQNSRKRDALGRGSVCPLSESAQNRFCEQCHEKLLPSEFVIFASRLGPHISWHPACFVCCVCKEILVDLIYFYKDGKIYCGRHHAETLKPRCLTCDEIIFADECTEAEGCSWHMRHFACFECNKLLAGQQYLMRDGRPYCCLCFELLYTDCCETCGQGIGLEEGRMTHNAHQWHARDACFSCRNCRKSLIGQPFLPKQSELYCSADCLTGSTRIPGSNVVSRIPGSNVVSCSTRKLNSDVGMAKVSMDCSLPEDCIGWESVSNRDDRSIVSTYSDANFKWTNTSLQDSHNLTETDSGLNLTFTNSVGHISEKEMSLGDNNKKMWAYTSDTSVFIKDKGFGNSPKTNSSMSPHVHSRAVVGKGGQNDSKTTKDQSKTSSPTICPADYMIDPEKYSLNSPITKSLVDCSCSLQIVNRTLSPQTVELDHPEESDVLYPVPSMMPFTIMSSAHAAGKLSPVNEQYDAEPSVEDSSLQMPNLPGASNQWDYYPTHRNPELPQIQLTKYCTYCKNFPCICHYKTSLPDLSYTSVVCDRDWREKPLKPSRSHASKTANLEMQKMESTGRHHPSGYASDSALKRRRVKRHQHEFSANPRSHGQPKLGTHHLAKSVHFPDELSSSRPLHHHQSPDSAPSNCKRLTDQFSHLQLEWDACSTCSSSSGDSEFDYYLDRPPIPHAEPVTPSPRRLKKRKSKQCIIS